MSFFFMKETKNIFSYLFVLPWTPEKNALNSKVYFLVTKIVQVNLERG